MNTFVAILYINFLVIYFWCWLLFGYLLYIRFIGPYLWYKRVVKEYNIKLPPVTILQHLYFIIASEKISGAYFPNTDQIHTLYVGYYESPFHYLYTVFHELGHYTGIESRLDRNKIGTSVGEYKKALERGDTDTLKKHLIEEFTVETVAIYLTKYYDLPLTTESLRKFRHRYFDLLPIKISFSVNEYRNIIKEARKATNLIINISNNKYHISYVWP